ncbi:MAG: amidohydrolase family protein [Acidobacteriota bacterium]
MKRDQINLNVSKILAVVIWVITAVLRLPSLSAWEPPPLYDMVILNGRVMDPESKLDGAGMNVGVRGGVIASVITEAIRGKVEIDAAGRVVAPGFIDIMSYNPNSYGIWYKVADGVTTNLAMHGGAVSPSRWYKNFERQGMPVNFGAGFFYNAVRLELGIDPLKPASGEEISRLANRARKALQEGSLGIGMSLEYMPGTSYEEVLEMMRVASEFGVPVFFHLRYSDMEPYGTNMDALEEVIRAARSAGGRVHIDHITSTGGTFSMEESLRLISVARSEGLDITACAYPYPYWGAYLNSARFAPGWQERFKIGYGDLQIGGTGERLTQESFSRYRRLGKLAVAYAIPENDVEKALKAPFVMVGSDGINEPHNNNHPRAAGTFARTLAVYVCEKKLLTLMEAIEKMTLLPARRLEARSGALRRKGRLREGMDADIVIFDPEKVKDTATVEVPNSFSIGIDYVIVNGTIVKDPAGLKKNRLPGRAVKTDPVQLPAF